MSSQEMESPVNPGRFMSDQGRSSGNYLGRRLMTSVVWIIGTKFLRFVTSYGLMFFRLHPIAGSIRRHWRFVYSWCRSLWVYRRPIFIPCSDT